ncbi:MAG: SDR family oxidoreductase [Chloroflexota bacterium]
MNPKEKIALITGGAHRVGKAMTMMLAEAGAHVIVNYNRSHEAAQETVAEAQKLGVQAMPIHADVADWQSVQRMGAQILEQFGGVDILINSASWMGRTPLPTDDIETWQQVTRISIDGTFYISNYLIPSMIERANARQQDGEQDSAGVIINVADLSAFRPWKNLTAHAVGKSAVLALTRQLALEFAPTLRVNAVAPGPVLPEANADERQIKMGIRRTLLKRWGTPEDVARAVKYLIEADYVTGDVLRVDGGEYYKG